MKIFHIIIISFLFTNAFYAQSVNKSLDSIINIRSEKYTKFIYITNGRVLVDTLKIKSVDRSKKDTSIILTFSDKSTKKIKAFEFWGIITDFGERRRFYNGKTYPVWRTAPPYFYKITFNNNSKYYFSESLTSHIYSLNKQNIDKYVNDSITRRNLNIYIEDHKIEANNTDNEGLDRVIDTSFEVATLLFELTGKLLILLAELIK